MHLAEHRGEKLPVRVLAEAGQIPLGFAHKILQKLSQAGLVESWPGPKGGFALKKEPGNITLLEIVEAIQGPLAVSRCLLGYEVCPRRKRCPLSPRLEEIQRAVAEGLQRITVGDLLAEDREGEDE